MPTLEHRTQEVLAEEARIREGGGPAGQKRQRELNRLTARERLAQLVDRDFFELGLWAGYGMYSEWGAVPAAGVLTGIGQVSGRACMVVANDATVKAGAFFPQTVKKVLRAQRIASLFRLPLVYLVDSAGVFLPLQDEIFPDEDDFGRIFRNNAVLSAQGIPQFAAIMGSCVAGGAYLPVLCDKVVMTEGSHLYLAGPALVKASIGQEVDAEALGGALMHAQISGTVDYREPDDSSCLTRLRSLVGLLPEQTVGPLGESGIATGQPADAVYRIVPDGRAEYDMREVLRTIVDAGSLQEYKADYGRTVVTAHARIGGHPVGIIANQRHRCKSSRNELQIGGVLYVDSVEKAARFVLDCNQTSLPLIFLQDVQGFMVGRESEQAGIIRAGAKLVNAVSNSVVPKMTVIVGGSFGAGNYALCGKAFDPWLILAWPTAQYTVMGPPQAAQTLLNLQLRIAERQGQTLSPEERTHLLNTIQQQYEKQMDIRYGAARGWVDAVIAPHETRRWLLAALQVIQRSSLPTGFRTGVFQV